MFSGNKTRLRELREADLETLNHWMNDWDVLNTLLRRVPSTLLATKDWYCSLKQDSSRVIFAIEENASQQFIGCVGLDKIEPVDRKGQFYIYIGEKKLWDQGLGTDASQTFFNYAFNSLNLNKIYLTVLADNEKGVHFYKKMGLKEEGRLLKEIFWEGEYHDLIRMALFKNGS